MTHICISKQTIIGSDNGLSPGRRQDIIRTNAAVLLIWTVGTNFSEILSEIHIFSFKKMHLKMSSAKWWQFCLGLKVLMLNVWGRSCPVRLQIDQSHKSHNAMDTCTFLSQNGALWDVGLMHCGISTTGLLGYCNANYTLDIDVSTFRHYGVYKCI